MATARSTLITDLGEEMGDVVTGTANSSGGDTTNLVDTSADTPFDPADDNQRYKGHWLHSTTQTAEHRITSYTVASQKVTTTAAFATSLDSDDYEIHGLISRADKVKALNRALTRRCYYRQYSPLTLIPDGDMETSGTTGWTKTNATLTKDTDAGDVFRGAQSMSLAGSDTANEFYRTTSINVREFETYRAEVVVRTETKSTLTLLAYDATNSANIDSYAYTYDDAAAWVRLFLTFQIPSGCSALRIICRSSANVTSYWDDLILTRIGQRRLNLPSWIDEEKKFEWVWIRTQDDPNDWELIPAQNCTLEYEPTAANPMAVVVSQDAVGRPLYVSGFRYYTSLGADATTTTAPVEWVKAATAVEILQKLTQPRKTKDVSGLRAELGTWFKRLRKAHAAHAPRRYDPLRSRMDSA